MRKIEEWLSEYGESHQNPTNKIIHFICVPLIFFSIVGLLHTIKLVNILGIKITLAEVILVGVAAYYFLLSVIIAIGMILFAISCLGLCYVIEHTIGHLLIVSATIFVLAWIAQFYGHKIEGKKPSFLKDIQFLMIGPAWIMSFLLRKIGLTVF
jgi:uncharacterized membrane protein YGL010W